MTGRSYTRRLNMNKREYEEVLSQMEARCGYMPGKDGRIAERFEFPVADIPIKVEHPDGGTASFLVFGRNISRSGMSVLHGGYLHPGSTCHIVLARVKEGPLVVRGEVRHCRLFAGSCHELGIRFEREIDPSLLVGSAPEEAMGGKPEPEEEVVQVNGRILVAEPFAPDHHLLEHRLGVYGLEVQIAETAGAVIDGIRLLKLDLILLGLRMVSQHGLRTIQKVRGMGFRRPIIALMAEVSPELEEQARAAGANEIIHKPYDINYLVAQIRVHLGDKTLARPVRSTEEDRPGMPPLIGKYVSLVRRTADQVERTFADSEWEELREYCYQLKGSGCSYGFQHMTVSAISALRALEGGETTDEAKTAITALLECCRALEFDEAILKTA
ncbi:MAG: response regulator [Planctomycetes bacterium]|nr:response regulator [Planctomycetota bacterium]